MLCKGALPPAIVLSCHGRYYDDVSCCSVGGVVQYCDCSTAALQWTWHEDEEAAAEGGAATVTLQWQ